MDILGPDQGKITIYGSDFQQVNLTPNGGVSPTGKLLFSPNSLGQSKPNTCTLSGVVRQVSSFKDNDLINPSTLDLEVF